MMAAGWLQAGPSRWLSGAGVGALLITLFILIEEAAMAAHSSMTHQESGFRDSMLAAINRARMEARWCGDRWFPSAPPLRWEEHLAEAARRHALEMARSGRLTHRGHDGTTPRKRAEAAGYRGMIWGENIAVGHESVAEVVKAWLKSPGHCKTIMLGRFTHMGAAYALGRSGHGGPVRFWVLDLGGP